MTGNLLARVLPVPAFVVALARVGATADLLDSDLYTGDGTPARPHRTGSTKG